MIIGNGLLANGFLNNSEKYNKHIIFASGVSNSKENNILNFNREKELIIKTITENKDLIFIYFSSILVDISNNDYYKHKLEIENIIKTKAVNYIIFRIPQVIGTNGNSNNLVNYLKNAILNDEQINAYKYVKRSLLDIDDLVNIVNLCNHVKNDTLYISGIEKIEIPDLINKIGLILNKKPIVKYNQCSDDNNWLIENSSIVNEAIDKLGIERLGYTDKIIKKYIW